MSIASFVSEKTCLRGEMEEVESAIMNMSVICFLEAEGCVEILDVMLFSLNHKRVEESDDGLVLRTFSIMPVKEQLL
jgi:hypothetical protein